MDGRNNRLHNYKKELQWHNHNNNINPLIKIAMKFLLAIAALFFATTVSSQEIVFNVNVVRIDTLQPTRVDLQSVKIIIGDRVKDTTQTEWINVTTHAVDSLNGSDYAIIVRHHKIPAAVYDNAFEGFDTKTGRPKLRLAVLSSLLSPYNLKVKQ